MASTHTLPRSNKTQRTLLLAAIATALSLLIGCNTSSASASVQLSDQYFTDMGEDAVPKIRYNGGEETLEVDGDLVIDSTYKRLAFDQKVVVHGDLKVLGTTTAVFREGLVVDGSATAYSIRCGMCEPEVISIGGDLIVEQSVMGRQIIVGNDLISGGTVADTPDTRRPERSSGITVGGKLQSAGWVRSGGDLSAGSMEAGEWLLAMGSINSQSFIRAGGNAQPGTQPSASRIICKELLGGTIESGELLLPW